MQNVHEEFLLHFEPIRERLWRFVSAMVYKYDSGNNEIARDVMSDTVLCVLEQFESMKDKQALLSYSFTIASRLYKAQFVRKKFWGLFSEEVAAEIPDTASSPELTTDIDILYKALELLPPKIKETVILFELSELSLQEIQQIQGGSLSGVKSRLQRGRLQLQELLQDEYSQKKESNIVPTTNNVVVLH